MQCYKSDPGSGQSNNFAQFSVLVSSAGNGRNSSLSGSDILEEEEAEGGHLKGAEVLDNCQLPGSV